MRVVRLQAENFKILKAVEIVPGEGPVIIGGANDQGKSSIMDAIWVALKGRGEADPVPIRDGEEECRIVLDIGEYIVQRKFTAKEGGTYTDSIKLLDDRGRIVPSPQAVLNDLLGAVGFDPFEFTKLKPEDQAAQLLQLVPLPIDLEQFADDDKRDYATRRDRNRDAEALEARIAALTEHEDLPDKPVDRDAILAKLSGAAETNGAIERERIAREGRAGTIEARKVSAGQLAGDIAEWERKIAAARTEIEELERGTAEREAELAALPPLDEPVNTEALRAALAAAEATNAKIESNARRAELVKQRAGLVAESAAFTAAMEGRETKRREALAKAKMPVEGLGFAVNERGKAVVTYKGLPFSQAGTAVQIRASTAIAMAANPDLRILRIKDGSLLDEATTKMIADMAEADDFQLWIEVVGEGAAGIIIEAGEVKGAKPAKGDGAPPAKKAAAKKPAGKDGEKLL